MNEGTQIISYLRNVFLKEHFNRLDSCLSDVIYRVLQLTLAVVFGVVIFNY